MTRSKIMKRGITRVLGAVLLFAACAIAVLPVSDAAAATYGYTIASSNSVQFWVNDAAWADLHYQINTNGQQNVRMTANGSNHGYTVNGIPTGATVRYFFTVGQPAGGAFDTPWAQFTMNGTPPPAGGWTVVWEDNFDGSGQPNPSNWNYHVGNGLNPGAGTFDGWGNGEWEWYRPEQAYLQGGNLVIRADYHTTPTNIAGRDWYQRSARITTQGKRSWTHGRVEARIQMPNAIGTWPALWMMGTSSDNTYTSNYNAPLEYYDRMASNWSSCGEIDIMEHRNTETVTFQNLFWDSRTGVFPWASDTNMNQPQTYGTGNVAAFHLYSIEWDQTEIRWYVDRETNPNPVHRVTVNAGNQEEFHKPFYIIMNLAISGQFTGGAHPNRADFPLYMRVDYVRVWQQQ